MIGKKFLSLLWGVTRITGGVLGSRSHTVTRTEQKSLYLEVPNKFSVYDNLFFIIGNECFKVLWTLSNDFLEIYNASFGSWAPVWRVIYLVNLTGQKQYVTELKWIWLVIVSGDSPEIISSPEVLHCLSPVSACPVLGRAVPVEACNNYWRMIPLFSLHISLPFN